MKKRRVMQLSSIMVGMVIVAMAVPTSAALVLETNATWTANGGAMAYSVHAADLNNDGAVEILTAGSVNYGPPVGRLAQLRIWKWNGLSLTPEWNEEFRLWNYLVNEALSVFTADVDIDGVTEIITAGYGADPNGVPTSHLVIWQWNGALLTREFDAAPSTPSTMRGVYAADLDGGPLEIVAVGERAALGAIWVFNWYEDSGSLIADATWPEGGQVRVQSVYAGSVLPGGEKGVVTAGYIYDVASTGQVRQYSYDDESLAFVTQEYLNWPGASTQLLSIHAADFDGTGTSIVACGRYFQGRWWLAGLRFFDLSLDYIADYTWLDGAYSTQCHGIYAVNLIGTPDLEVISAGLWMYGGTYGEIRTFNFYTTSPHIRNEQSYRWETELDTEAHGVYALNVDGDPDMEVLSAGQTKDLQGILWAELRITHMT